jgi:hypothetical protein
LCWQKIDYNIETTTDDDLGNPIKRAKCSESPTFSTPSLVSECPESISSEVENQSALSPVSQLMNEETISAHDDDQIFSEDGEKQQETKHIINSITYDYLPQGKI